MDAQGMFAGGDVPYPEHPPGDPAQGHTGGEAVAENERLRAELEQLGEKQREVMELLNCKSPDRIVHDLRNVLNELNLYRSLVENDA